MPLGMEEAMVKSTSTVINALQILAVTAQINVINWENKYFPYPFVKGG